MAHGQGVETNPDGTCRHNGQWIEDKPVLTPRTEIRHVRVGYL
jgi:hypothetical protein